MAKRQHQPQSEELITTSREAVLRTAAANPPTISVPFYQDAQVNRRNDEYPTTSVPPIDRPLLLIEEIRAIVAQPPDFL